MSSLCVREYRHEDLRKLLWIDGKSSKRRQDKFALLACDPFYCYVAEDGENLRGFLIMEDLGDRVSHYMAQINVAQKRQGIGRMLVTRMFEEIGKGGHISLCVNTDNYDAIGFYEAMGFKWSGYVIGYRKDQNKFWYRINL